MDIKVVLLCIESALLVLLLIGVVVISLTCAKWHRAYEDLKYSAKSKKGTQNAAGEAEAQPVVVEPAGYVRGKDRFLDNLTTDERKEFYKTFIFNSCCGLNYKSGADNAVFFGDVFINLSGVRFAVSDSLMHKICIEYDRLRGMPVTADNK